ncbi:cysteine desulfurase family protein [Cyclobacterium marinum]|uniref:cysteine desulfurase family protein n=1 Tax=Cyclobacterium marinum TaxID=104 RepID=UPI0011EFD521|nr:cysteine desulfurase family protein [Cyclobacterium marinum]MBI0398328.1 cysteine desulfurase [Cyclobacterium marinum]
MDLPIYFDYNASTPCFPEVVEAILPYFTSAFGNASSIHHPYGWLAEEAVETARERVATLIGAEASEIVFTSGATEAINLGIKGIAQMADSGKNHLITIATEHKAVQDTLEGLTDQGFELTCLPVNAEGEVSLDQLKSSFRENTLLVVAMLANNETGNLHPINAMAALAKNHGAIFLTDAVQAVGKIPVDVKELGVDLLALSGHKMYAPKGVGALYIRKGLPKIKLKAQITGGGQERGLRSGTLNVPGIVGLGEAAVRCLDDLQEEGQRLLNLRNQIEKALLQIKGSQLNGSSQRLPHVCNVSFNNISGKSLMIRVNKKIAISSGAACSSISDKPSHVLTAMGLDQATAMATLRVSLGRFTTAADIEFAIEYIIGVVKDLRTLAS